MTDTNKTLKFDSKRIVGSVVVNDIEHPDKFNIAIVKIRAASNVLTPTKNKIAGRYMALNLGDSNCEKACGKLSDGKHTEYSTMKEAVIKQHDKWTKAFSKTKT